jgi:hypothetical protein
MAGIISIIYYLFAKSSYITMNVLYYKIMMEFILNGNIDLYRFKKFVRIFSPVLTAFLTDGTG